MRTDYVLSDGHRNRHVYVDFVGGELKYKAYAKLPYFEDREFANNPVDAIDKLVTGAAYCGWFEVDADKRDRRTAELAESGHDDVWRYKYGR